ncbi:MAG: elongation factor 1-beta [Candidatus Woesearchaeota archaeon]
MAKAIVTVRLMMESPETDPSKVEEKAKEAIESLKGEFGRSSIEPIAFGIKALDIIFIIDEMLGTDEFENKLNTLDGVSSAEIRDFRRAIG